MFRYENKGKTYDIGGLKQKCTCWMAGCCHITVGRRSKNAGKRVFEREMDGCLIELAILMNDLDILRWNFTKTIDEQPGLNKGFQKVVGTAAYQKLKVQKSS